MESEQLLGALHELDKKVASIDTGVHHLQSDVKLLNKVIIEGNGVASVLTRLSHLETKVVDFKESYKENRVNGIHVKAALITAGFSLIATLVTAFLK